jgi:diaminohydroxyphosphoribosylaminopyrimidine deaminase / 5-amino-6-(5-phosphoribosylamino)uracil reductase
VEEPGVKAANNGAFRPGVCQPLEKAKVMRMSLKATGEQDRQWMRRALELAEQSVGLSSPNPAVGCVLTRDDRLVGEGFHEYDKRDHAEVVALKQAGELAEGATAYVTLEPCSHQGRTGPCADALLAAGIKRVVIATADPNPIVHGLGIQRLLQGGVEVETGVLTAPARKLNDGFAAFKRTALPFVTMKVASSLDGRIAPAQNAAKPHAGITGEAARQQVHRMRHSADALLTGVGTILADDPLLTDRSGLPRRRPLLRVVLDSHLRTPVDSQLIQTANDDVLIFFVEATSTRERALKSRGIHVERLEQSPMAHADEKREARASLAAAIQRLGALDITSVLVEGGAGINAAVINDKIADKLVLFYAPIFLGQHAVPMLASHIGQPPIQDSIKILSAPSSIKDSAISPTLHQIGQDFAFEAYLRDPWAGVQ